MNFCVSTATFFQIIESTEKHIIFLKSASFKKDLYDNSGRKFKSEGMI